MAKRTMPDPGAAVRSPMRLGGGPPMKRRAKVVPGLGDTRVLTERERAALARKYGR